MQFAKLFWLHDSNVRCHYQRKTVAKDDDNEAGILQASNICVSLRANGGGHW